MTQAERLDQTPPAPKGTRFRVNAGGLIIPVAIIGGISALETARTTDASREVFWNVSTPWLMYFVFGVSLAVILGAFIQRLRIWRLGKPQPVFNNIGARLTNALVYEPMAPRLWQRVLGGEIVA